MKHVIMAVGLCASTAAAQPAVLENGAEDIISQGASKLEGRFKADTTNWDVRLETNGFPIAGDNQGHLGNGRSFFEGQNFAFDLSYDAFTRVADLSVTRDDGIARIRDQADVSRVRCCRWDLGVGVWRLQDDDVRGREEREEWSEGGQGVRHGEFSF